MTKNWKIFDDFPQNCVKFFVYVLFKYSSETEKSAALSLPQKFRSFMRRKSEFANIPSVCRAWFCRACRKSLFTAMLFSIKKTKHNRADKPKSIKPRKYTSDRNDKTFLSTNSRIFYLHLRISVQNIRNHRKEEFLYFSHKNAWFRWFFEFIGCP